MGEALWPYVLEFVRGAVGALGCALIGILITLAAYSAIKTIALLEGWKGADTEVWLWIASVSVSVIGSLWLFGWLYDELFSNPVRACGFLLASFSPFGLGILSNALAEAPQPSESPPHNAELPIASYLSWPVPTMVTLCAATLLGAYSGSGGTPGGFIVAFLLNPLLWAAGWAYWKSGQLRCPHCRRGIRSREIRNAAVGKPIYCSKCNNWSAKPAA